MESVLRTARCMSRRRIGKASVAKRRDDRFQIMEVMMKVIERHQFEMDCACISRIVFSVTNFVCRQQSVPPMLGSRWDIRGPLAKENLLKSRPIRTTQNPNPRTARSSSDSASEIDLRVRVLCSATLDWPANLHPIILGQSTSTSPHALGDQKVEIRIE